MTLKRDPAGFFSNCRLSLTTSIKVQEKSSGLKNRRVIIKGFVIAGTQSGCGKTTVALGLMLCLVRRGLAVAPFKVGPDFIDPGHHLRITGKTSRNLDGWMLSNTYNLKCFKKSTEKADIAVVEGVMGLFDGYDGKSEAGSTAQMAKWLGLPVILVVNAKSMARSAAALVQGFERFDKDLRFAGILFNNIGSKRHLKYLKEALTDNVNMPCLGGIPHDNEISIPERHLGLVTRQDHPLSDEFKNLLADTIEKNIDVKALLDLYSNLESIKKIDSGPVLKPAGDIRIGVARDNAFCFYYQDNFDMLEKSGAELVSFSPVEDNKLPENLHGIYFGGGYPELYAGQLSSRTHLRKQIKEKSNEGMPIYGECGGFMYLCKEICDTDGKIYSMTGCFPFTTSMFTKLRSLGYREILMAKDTVIGKAGCKIRGHEYHYSELKKTLKEIETVYEVSDGSGKKKGIEGYQVNQTLGSYNHLHFGSRPESAAHFVEACRNYKREKGVPL